MKPRFGMLLFCLFLVSVPFTSAPSALGSILPDACGSDSVKFDVKLQKNPPAPAGPADGKAQIVFIEISDSKKQFACRASFTSCDTLARFGVDGKWVGATKGKAFFTVSIDPGVHHLCGVVGNKIGMEALTAEAGKVYYYQANYNVEGTQYGNAEHPNYQIKKSADFTFVSEDEGKYRVKISDLSTATQKE